MYKQLYFYIGTSLRPPYIRNVTWFIDANPKTITLKNVNGNLLLKKLNEFKILLFIYLSILFFRKKISKIFVKNYYLQINTQSGPTIEKYNP